MRRATRQLRRQVKWAARILWRAQVPEPLLAGLAVVEDLLTLTGLAEVDGIMLTVILPNVPRSLMKPFASRLHSVY